MIEFLRDVDPATAVLVAFLATFDILFVGALIYGALHRRG